MCVTATDTLTGHLVTIAKMGLTSAAGADETDLLLGDAARGDSEAIRNLLERHRARLRRMVTLRLDSQLAARVDASDVVQEALFDAARKLAEYARERPLPFYAWLYRLAVERVADAYRRHWRCASRSVRREEVRATTGSDLRARMLADRLAVTDLTPRHILIRRERQQQVTSALARLVPSDRDVLLMRYVEDLSFPDIAAILGIGEGAAKMRHLRALQRMRTHIECDGSG
jgi:RNA polymerase sigma-70 factor (ECF subfamily)